jgi:hypothetical protein
MKYDTVYMVIDVCQVTFQRLSYTDAVTHMIRVVAKTDIKP